MSVLPRNLRDLMEELLERSGLEGAEADRARRDLREHLLEGLEAGRTPEELAARFGDPGEVAPLLGRAPPPVRPGLSGAGGEGTLTSLLRELRHVSRRLLTAPTFTLTAVVVLAVGIAAAVVAATIVNEAILRPLQIEDQPSVVDIWAEIPGANSFVGFAWRDFIDFRDRSDVLQDLAAFSGVRMRLGEEDESGQEVLGQLVSANYFDLLGLEASLGRLDLPEAPPFGGEQVAVLSHDFWRSAFGSDPEIVGRTIRLDDRRVTVVGVGPREFTGTFIGFPMDVWLPLAAAVPFLSDFDPDDRTSKPFELIGRMRPGGTPAEVDRSLDGVAAEVEAEHPVANDGLRVGVASTTGVDHSLREAVATFVAVLVAISAMVLLIACLNVGSLLLVRTMSREREVAVRMALGAGRGRLAARLLAESGVLVAVASVLGVAGAREINVVIAEFARSVSGGLGFDLAVDWRVLALTVGAAVTAALAAGLAPALHLLRRDPAGALRARTDEGRAGGRLRTALVVGQVAVSVVLVVVTGLFGRAVLEGRSADPGFAADGVASFSLALDTAEHGAREARVVRESVLRDLRGLPGVEGATVADAPPLVLARSPTRIHVPGMAPPAGRDSLVVDARRVGGGYLETLDIPLLRGRDVTEADARSPVPVAVVSRAFAEEYWPGQEGVGRTVGAGGRSVRVVGVADDARYMVQDRTPDPLLYLSMGDRPLLQPHVILRAGNPAAVSGAVNEVVRGLAPGHPTVRLQTAREVLRRALFPQRVGVMVIGSMGLVALLLAALGLYGLVQFSVTRNRRELGVRLALGGGPRSVMAAVLRKGFALAAVGTAVGVVAALVLTPTLRRFLVDISPRDPVTYGAVVVSFVAVAFLASWLPARRAMRIRPAEVLRGE